MANRDRVIGSKCGWIEPLFTTACAVAKSALGAIKAKPVMAAMVLMLLVCPKLQAQFVEQTVKSGPVGTPDSPAKAAPESRSWVTHNQVRIGGATVSYTATVGIMLMKNEKDEPIALFGYTAYVKDGADLQSRPLLFAYNGGPGSSSIWLHMGVLGPRRTVLEDGNLNTRGPFRMVENEDSILDQADLVMIDPIGTGLSRPVGKAEGKDFWGVDQDIKSVSEFIVSYLHKYGRWTSPKFLLGESYGGMRSGGVAYALLSRHNVSLNGVALVSPYMDVVGGDAGMGTDLAHVNYLPGFAAVAYYHHALTPQPPALPPFLREVEAFAREVYAPFLHKGNRATAMERKTVIEGLVKFTGIKGEYWEKANLRVSEDQFTQELLRNRGQVAGRIDGRFKNGSYNPLSEKSEVDPYDASIAPAIEATFHQYFQEVLKATPDRPYVTSAPLWKTWDYQHAQPNRTDGLRAAGNTIVDLAMAMTQNPRMKVLVQQGFFDLATPYTATEYFIDHLNISPDVRKNLSLRTYEAGHMMYVHPASRTAFKNDLAAFISGNAR